MPDAGTGAGAQCPSKLIKREAGILAATFLAAVIGGGLGARSVLSNTPAAAPPKLLSVSSAYVIGSRYPVGRVYALVEFLDYQCPPCRASSKQVKELVQAYGGKVRLVIRNRPLSIHPNAASASAAAEAARALGRFMPMHDALLNGRELNDSEVRSLARFVGLNDSRFRALWKGAARTDVAEDIRAADALGIRATPTFMLCSPDGRVWRLAQLDQLHDLVR